jgi:uncharacterized protein (DUF1330 family)
MSTHVPKKILYVCSLVLCFASGAAVMKVVSLQREQTQAASGHARAAYLVASWELHHPERLSPFIAAVVPLARNAGWKNLATGEPRVLEGAWPYRGILIVQRYESMQSLLNFWYSPEHRAAIALRTGLVDSHFVVAVEADAPEESE